MEYGKKADYNTVWVPLSEENSEVFDETKAWEFIDQHMGIDYGWQNLLTGWLVSNLIFTFRKANCKYIKNIILSCSSAIFLYFEGPKRWKQSVLGPG